MECANGLGAANLAAQKQNPQLQAPGRDLAVRSRGMHNPNLCRLSISPMLSQELTVDCTNGVGALKLAELASQLQPLGLGLALRATGDGELNGGCGSDHVQKERVLPAGFGPIEPGARYAAIFFGDSEALTC